MSTARIRPARPEDLPDLARIYDHYVVHTHVTFDLEPFGAEGRRPWLEGFAPTGPHRLLVGEREGRVLGYASSGRFRAKAAYDRSVETTIYLDPDATGRRLGHRLYAALLETLRAEPAVHRAYAGVALPNPASIALHERHGFHPVGTLCEVGFKLGHYWDVAWYEKALSP